MAFWMQVVCLGPEKAGWWVCSTQSSGTPRNLTHPCLMLCVTALLFFLLLKMESTLVGCLLLLLGQSFFLSSAARERPHTRALSRGRHARTHPQMALLGEWQNHRLREGPGPGMGSLSFSVPGSSRAGVRGISELLNAARVEDVVAGFQNIIKSL